MEQKCEKIIDDSPLYLLWPIGCSLMEPSEELRVAFAGRERVVKFPAKREGRFSVGGPRYRPLRLGGSARCSLWTARENCASLGGGIPAAGCGRILPRQVAAPHCVSRNQRCRGSCSCWATMTTTAVASMTPLPRLCDRCGLRSREGDGYQPVGEGEGLLVDILAKGEQADGGDEGD